MLLSRKLIDPRRLAVMALLGLVSQSALSGEVTPADRMSVEVAPISAEQVEADAKAFIEAVNRRLASELAAETIQQDVDAPRVELASVEAGTRG